MNHLVEGPFRDPASLNKPSTAPLPENLRIGDIPGWDVHWGLVLGVVCCIGAWVLIERTTLGWVYLGIVALMAVHVAVLGWIGARIVFPSTKRG